MTDQSVITFVVDKNDEKPTFITQSPAYTQQVVLQSVYKDTTKSLVIGYLHVNKQIYSLDSSLNTIPGVTNSNYSYSINWTSDTHVPGVSTFVILPEDKVVSNGTSEVPGTYYGAIDGVNSSGNFRNYGGSVVKTKDASNFRYYTLKYYQSTPYNTLP